jgi:signal transduction histidine kinase
VSLQRTVGILTLVVTLLAVVLVGALVLLTTTVHRATALALASVESVRLAEQIEIELLHHARAEDPLVRQRIEGRLHHKLSEAQRFVNTQPQVLALSEAELLVDDYVEIADNPTNGNTQRLDAQEAAYAALNEFTTLAVTQARAAQRVAARWDKLATVIGTGASVLLIVVATVLLVWLKGGAFAPLFELAKTMERFGRGDHDVRASERGPAELRDMCRRFNEMAAAVAARRHAQMAFLGGVAHDLRNPLAALQMSVVALLDDLPPTSDRGVRQAVEVLGRQLKRMDRMLGDFLDGAKIEVGLLELRVDVHDARTIVAEVVELFTGMSARHSLEVRLPDSAVPIRCDHLRIEQVITNLISNAIKYSPKGGCVEVALRAGASELELSVTDHGIGIAEGNLAAVFEPFRRVGLSSEAVPGVGLGLFVVRKIVEAHGGRIEVSSVPGVGSTFRVFLPAGAG